MRETPKQKMERLERTVAERNETIKALNKENRQLNSQLKKIGQETAAEKDDVISSLQSQIQEQNQQYLNEIDRKTAIIKKYETKIERLDEINKKLSDDHYRFSLELSANKMFQIMETISKLKNYRPCDVEKERVRSFQNGEHTYKAYFGRNPLNPDEDDFPSPLPFFDVRNLLIWIDPKTGRELNTLDYVNINGHIHNRYDYIIAQMELKEFRKSAPSKEELDDFVYKKGMELLPLYEEWIL